LAFTFYYLYTIRDLAWEAAINGYLTGSIIILLVMLLLIKTAIKVFRGKLELHPKIRLSISNLGWKRLGLIFLTLIYIIAIWWGGFILPTFFFLMAGMLLLGVRSKILLCSISAIFSLVGYVSFTFMLDVRFPEGPIEKLIIGFF
jgi:hypothetical protein